MATADVTELENLLRDMNEKLRGSLVKTASRVIIRLRQENHDLLKELAAGREQIDPLIMAHMEQAAGVISHKAGSILNAPADTPEALEVQARALKLLAEALSTLARGTVPGPDGVAP